MEPEPAKVRVAFIAGAGLSGSTLLEQALSQVDGCVSIGELHCLWQPYWPLMTCECGEEFKSCPFWQTVLGDAYGAESEAIRARVCALGEGFLRHSIAPALAGSKSRFSPAAAFSELGTLLEPIYRTVQRNTGATIVVDASKSGLWGLSAVTATNVELDVVHLVRDPRGFASSNGRARPFFYPPGSMTTPRGPARSYVNWNLAQIEAEILGRRAHSNTLVLYEDLARDPSGTFASIAEVLGLPPESAPFRGNELTVSRTGHTMGGNPRRPRSGTTVISADERWRTSGSRALRTLGPILSGPLWFRYRRKAARRSGAARASTLGVGP